MHSFRIVLAGTLLPGFALNEVRVSLARLMKQSEIVAAQLLSGHTTVIKSGLDEATAQQYVSALRKIGVACDSEPETLELELGVAAVPAAAPSRPLSAPSAPAPPAPPARKTDYFALIGVALVGVAAWYFLGDRIKDYASTVWLNAAPSASSRQSASNDGPGSVGGVCVDSSVTSLMKKIVGEKMESEVSWGAALANLVQGKAVDITKVEVTNMRTVGGNVGTGRRTCYATVSARAEWTEKDGVRHWRETVVPLKIEYREEGFNAGAVYSPTELQRDLWAALSGDNLTSDETATRAASLKARDEDAMAQGAGATTAAKELPPAAPAAAAPAGTTMAPRDIALTYARKKATKERCVLNEDGLTAVMGKLSGIPEDVIVTTYPVEGCGGGNNWGVVLEVLSGPGGEPKGLGWTGGPGFDDVVVISGAIGATVTSYGPDDARCCPTVKRRTVFVLEGGKLVVQQ